MKDMGIGSIIMNVFTFLAGVAAIVWGIYGMQSNSSNWPSVEGQIMSSTGPDYSSDLSNENSTYDYIVDGTTYTSSCGTAYDVGTKVTVYYDPADPGVSVLSKGEMEFYGCIGFIFGLFAVGGIILNLIKIQRAAAEIT